MKRLVYLAVASAFAFALYSCGDTNDCVCTYEDGTEATVNDWSGDCSQINVIDLTKKQLREATLRLVALICKSKQR